MKKVIEDERRNVTQEEIDLQHKEMNKMVTRLRDETNPEVNSETISDMLTDMTEYADYHFKTEEQYLRNRSYPDYDEHKNEHIKFIEQTVLFCMNTMEYKESVPDDILSYLGNWFETHTINSDMKYRKFFDEQDRQMASKD